MLHHSHSIESEAHLAAQAHGLYLRLRDRTTHGENYRRAAEHAYNRYQRRISRQRPRRVA